MLRNKVIKSDRKVILYIFLAALLARAMFFFTVSVVLDMNLSKDFEYGIIARSLMAGEGYSVPVLEQSSTDNTMKELDIYRPSAYHLPFYPMLLATIYTFVKSPISTFVLVSLQVLLASVTCILIYLVALRIFADRKVATIAGCLMIFNPTFILYVVRLIPETILIFWLSLMLLYLLLLKNSPSYSNSLIAGTLLGVSLLTSNVVVPMIPFIVIWLLISLTISLKQRVKIIILTMFTAFMVVSPWLVRNYIVFKEFPLMKTTLGHNLWLGNNPKATGTFYDQAGEEIRVLLLKDFIEGQKLSELEQDKGLHAKAMEFIKKNPAHYVWLSMKRFYYFIWFPPDNFVSGEALFHKKISEIPYGLILISCIAGAFLSLRKYPKEVFLIFSIILSQALLFSFIIVGHPRYRMTIEPYIILFSAYTASFLLDKYALIYKRRK